MSKRIDRLYQELGDSGNLINTVSGYVDTSEHFDEDRYYYYYVKGPVGGNDVMIPVQIVSGLIQKLSDVNGTFLEPSDKLPSPLKLFSVKGNPIGVELESLIKDQDSEYSSETYKKYIDTALKYEELRE